MKEKIIRCPICKKIVALDRGTSRQKLEPVNGITWQNVGYSIGAWGHFKNILYDFCGEICIDCFTPLETKLNELQNIINQRTDSCEEGVCIYKKSKVESAGDNMPNLQQDQFQHKRRGKSLLRLLPFVSHL